MKPIEEALEYLKEHDSWKLYHEITSDKLIVSADAQFCEVFKDCLRVYFTLPISIRRDILEDDGDIFEFVDLGECLFNTGGEICECSVDLDELQEEYRGEMLIAMGLAAKATPESSHFKHWLFRLENPLNKDEP